VESASNIVGTATTFATISANHQRKLFYASDYHWAFHCNDSHILYSTSSDGLTWNTPTVIREGISSSGISVWYDGNVHYAYASAALGSPVVYRRGYIQDRRIEWEAEWTAASGVKGTTYFLTNDEEGLNMWAMKAAAKTTSDTTLSIRTGTHTNGTYFLFQPGQEIATPQGTSLPVMCTRKGWRTVDKLNATILEGTWKIVVQLVNRAETAHTGRICLRLWKSSEANISQTTAITDWIESKEIAFSPTIQEAKKTTLIQISNMIFKDEFLFIELGWKIETPGSDGLTGLKLFCNQESGVTTVTYEYYNGYCVLDSNGYPWAAYFINDGYYWASCVAKAESLDGSTWSTPVRISESATSPWRTCILPLNNGKIFAIYAGTAEVKGRLWNGTTWGPEENITETSLSQDYGYSAISHNSDVHLAVLENATYNILHYRRSLETGWHSEVLQTNQSSISLPVLSVDKSTGNLYCFWLHKNTLYVKKHVDGAWEDSNSFCTTFDLPRGISCFYQAWDRKIGVAWVEKSNSLFKVRYRFLTLSPHVYSGVSGNSSSFYVYATQGCKECQKQVQLLEELYGGGSTVFYDILDGKNGKHYRKIVDFLVDMEMIDPSDPIRSVIPLSGFFNGGELKAIIFGRMSEEDWKRIVDAKTDGVALYFMDETEPAETIQEQVVIETISEHFKQTAPLTPDSRTESLMTLLKLVSLTAVVDAVNPCELNAFLLLLVYVFYHVGKRAVLKAGLVFSAAVFITYYLMGVGLLRVFQGIPQLRWAITAFGLIVGALEVTTFFGKERKHVPDVFTTKIKETLEKALNPYTAFLAGVIVSLLLLPCTSGPYFITLELMTQKATLVEGLILLIAYNAIIIAPFLAVTLIIYTLTFRTFKLRKWITEKERWFRLFTGITMISISLILITL